MNNHAKLSRPIIAVTHDGDIALAGITPGPQQDIAIQLNGNFDAMANIWHWTRRDSDNPPPNPSQLRYALKPSCYLQLPPFIHYAEHFATLNRELAKLVIYAAATKMSRLNSGIAALMPDGSTAYLTHHGLPIPTNKGPLTAVT